MANVKISELPAASTPLDGTETLPIVKSGVTDKVSVANLTAGRAISASDVTVTNLTASQAVLTDASKNLTSVGTTGTGNIVRATSPTLVTPTLGAATASSLTNTGLTSGRVVYSTTGGLETDSANLTFDGTTLTAAGLSGPHNGTVGATTPNTGAFTTLSASSSVTLSGGTANGVLYLNGSKVATSGSAVTYDGTTFTTTGAANFATSSGNVGIGTASPQARADVRSASNGLNSYGQLFVASTDSQAGDKGGAVSFGGSYTGTTQTYWASIFGAKENSTDGQYGGYLAFGTRVNGGSTTERMRIDSSGNVGIGTTNAGTAGLSISQNLNLSWEQSATESVPNLFRQTSSAALVMSMGYKRSVNANAFASSYGSSLAKTAISLGTTAGAITFYTDTAATTAVGTDVTPTERMRIDSSGNVGIGTASPSGNLQVSGANPRIRFSNTNGTASTLLFGADSGSVFLGAETNAPIYFITNNTERMRIDSSGNVLVGTAIARNILTVTGPNATPPALGTAAGTALFCPAGTTYGTMIGSSGGGQGWIQQQRVDGSAAAYDLWIQPSGGNVGIGTTNATSTLTVNGSFGAKAPSTVNAATYSVAATDYSLRFTTTNCTVTLPAAAGYPGRILVLNTITANSVTSASSNVIPLGSNTAGTAILAATLGKFTMLQSDGTNWITLLSN